MTQDNADAKLREEVRRLVDCAVKGDNPEVVTASILAAWNTRSQSADAGVESAVKSVQRRLAELTGDRRIDDELRFELRTAIRYIQEDARHPSSDATPKQADEAARPDGLLPGLDHIANFLNALDTEDMTANEVRSAVYSECLQPGCKSSLRASPAQAEAGAGVGETTDPWWDIEPGVNYLARAAEFKDRALVGAEYRLSASPHEWTPEDSEAMARFVFAALGALEQQRRESIALMELLAKARTRPDTEALAEARREVERLSDILDTERYKVAIGVQEIARAVQGRKWLSQPGRGSYTYDDERYQQEFGAALDEIQAALKPLSAIAADWSDCPRDPLRVEKNLQAAIRAAKDTVK